MNNSFFSKIQNSINKTILAFTRNEQLSMIVIGGVVGTTVGYGAIVFQGLIAAVAKLGWGNFTHMEGRGQLVMALAAPLWIKILIPTAGGLIVGIIVFFIAQEAKGHGVPEVIESVVLTDL